MRRPKARPRRVAGATRAGADPLLWFPAHLRAVVAAAARVPGNLAPGLGSAPVPRSVRPGVMAGLAGFPSHLRASLAAAAGVPGNVAPPATPVASIARPRWGNASMDLSAFPKHLRTEVREAQLVPNNLAPGVRGAASAQDRKVFSHGTGAWAWGADFPVETSDCGWTLEGRVAPLLDPNPCVYASGTVEGDDLGWWLTTGSTYTTRLQTGRYRMYFANGALDRQTTDSARQYDVWPIVDAGGRNKFTLDSNGLIGDEDRRKDWWHATADDVADLHFSAVYISFLDSSDGVEFPLYAPWVEPATAATCEDVDYTGATVTYEDTSTGFRAGWKSTSIPSGGASVVYRDVSVVYLEDVERYLMFVVECDGRGLGSGGSDLVYEDACSFCTPDGFAGCTGSTATTPVTAYVFFTCPDADFQEDVKGPFPLAPAPPDPASGQWIGVPQAFLSPSESLILWWVGYSAGYSYGGMHVGRASALASVVPTLEAAWDAGADMSAFGAMVYAVFHNFGTVDVERKTPTACTTPTSTDEHFVFCSDGRLHLYFTNRSTGDVNDPLDLVSHAFAAAEVDEDRMETWLATGIDPESAYGSEEEITLDRRAYHITSGEHAIGVWMYGSSMELSIDRVNAIGLASEADEEPAPDFADMVARFTMASCDPIDLPALLGTATVTNPSTGLAIDVACNDPDVYLARDGNYQMLFHSQALGGMVRASASAADTCLVEPSVCLSFIPDYFPFR